MQIVQCCVALVLTSCYNTIGTNHKACHLFLVENLFWQYRCNHELDKRRLLWVVLSRLFDVPFCVVFLCVFGYVPTCNAVAACNSIACEGLVVVLSRLCVVPFANCNAVAACNSMTKRRLLWVVFVPFCVVFGYVSTCNAVATRNLLASSRLSVWVVCVSVELHVYGWHRWRVAEPGACPWVRDAGWGDAAVRVSPQNAHTIFLNHASVTEMSLDSPINPGTSDDLIGWFASLH